MLFILCSCGTDLLDHKPETSVTAGNFYQSQDDIDKAVTGIYEGMQDWTVNIYFYLSEVRSKNFWAVFADGQRDWYDISNFSIRTNSSTISNVWINNYETINSANEVLARVDDIEFTDETLRERYKAEARFLRAFAYFQLVRIFNRVPLVIKVITEEEALEIGQSEPNELYDFIVAEMSDVVDQFPPEYQESDQGRITEWAAKGILARVYMTMAGYPLNETDRLNDAKSLLEEIIAQEGSYITWADNYADLFSYDSDNQFHIFEIQYESGSVGAGNALPAQVYPADLDVQYAPYISANRLTVSEDIITEFRTNDLRFESTIATVYQTQGGGTGTTAYFSKFFDPDADIPERGDYPINFPLLRYADVLLMHAEIENEQQGPTPSAINKLNRIRNRAGLDDISPTTQENFRLALEAERRREFAFEGRYWFDLVRTGRAIPVMNQWFNSTEQDIEINENKLVYPLPLNELDVFPGLYEQNPGY